MFTGGSHLSTPCLGVDKSDKSDIVGGHVGHHRGGKRTNGRARRHRADSSKRHCTNVYRTILLHKGLGRCGELNGNLIINRPPHAMRVSDQAAACPGHVLCDHAGKNDAHILQLAPAKFNRHHFSCRVQVNANSFNSLAASSVEPLLCLVLFLRENVFACVNVDQHRPTLRRSVSKPESQAAYSIARIQLQRGESSIHRIVVVKAVRLCRCMPIPSIHRATNTRDGHVVQSTGTVDRKCRRHTPPSVAALQKLHSYP